MNKPNQQWARAKVQAAHRGLRDLYFFLANIYFLKSRGFDSAIGASPGQTGGVGVVD